MNNNKLRLWIFRLILIPLALLIPLLGLIDDSDLHIILFYGLGISVLHLCLIGISVNFIGIRTFILPHTLPHYHYITTPISSKELLIREIKHILTHKYTCYIIIIYYITLIINNISLIEKFAIGTLFIILLFFFTTFFVFFCNSDFKFAWLKRNAALFSVPLSSMAIFGTNGIKMLIIYSLVLLTISILLSIVYYRKAIKAMQEPFDK